MQHSPSDPEPTQTAATLRAPLKLPPGESALAVLQVDLSEQLHFVDSQLVLTERRLLVTGDNDAPLSQWVLDEPAADRLSLRHTDHGGVGTLEHLSQGIRIGGADAVLAASIFHYGEFTVGQAKALMARDGIAVRL